MTDQAEEPSSGRHDLIKGCLRGWVDLVNRHPMTVLACVLVITALSIFVTSQYLGVDTNTEGMLSEDLKFRKDFDEFKNTFPHLINSILVVVQGPSRETTTRSAGELTNRLRNNGNLFKEVSYPEGNPFFKTHFLLYKKTDELRFLTNNLDALSPLLEPTILERSLPGLFNGFSNLFDRIPVDSTTDPKDRPPSTRSLIRKTNRSLRSVLDGAPQPLSWYDIFAKPDAPSGEHLGQWNHTSVILVKPDLSFDSIIPGQTALSEIRTVAKQVSTSSDQHVRIRLTGDIPLQNDELKQAMTGVMLGGALSLVLVVLILYLALRSMKLIVYSLITLLVGLSWTFGFTAVTIGDLNLISIAFVVLYIGLGIDYAIHFCLMYNESAGEAPSTGRALRGTAGLVGTSLLLCSITTAIGFYSFIPTSYVGISELGLIGGTGMFVSFIVTLSVLPALLSLSSPVTGRPPNRNAFNFVQSITRLSLTYRWPFLFLVLLFAGVCGWFMTGLSFEYNPMQLRDPGTESVRTYLDLFETKSPPSSIHILAKSRDEASRLKQDLNDQEAVKQVRTLDDFLPGNQQQKLKLIRNLSLMNSLREQAGAEEMMRFMGNQLSGTDIEKTFTPEEASLDDLRTSIRNSVDKLNKHLPQDAQAKSVQRLKQTKTLLEQCLARLREGSKKEQNRFSGKLQHALLSRFGRVLFIVHSAATAREVTVNDLPDRIVSRWTDGEGQYRVDVFPNRNTTNTESLRSFVTDVREVSASATGPPVVFLSAGEAVVDALLWAFGIAVVAMSGYLLLQLRSKWDVVFIMVPLLIAGVYVCGLMVLLGLSFNYANVIVLPLLLGIGADNSIHMIHRFRSSENAVSDVLGSTTARAVLFSVVTTTGSFFNLVFSPHLGMSSMGLVLTLGMIIILFSTMCILPAMLSLREAE